MIRLIRSLLFGEFSRKFVRPILFSDYGTLIVLFFLCVYYSAVTWELQNPETPAAGRKLGKSVAKEFGDDANVLILARAIDSDKQFANAVSQELAAAGCSVLNVVLVDQPFARNARLALEEAALQHQRIDVIATHHPGSSWGPLRGEKLIELASTHESLANAKVAKPLSFMWPSFLTRENLLSVINRNSEIFIIAIGMTMVIITAGIDLSVGSMLALASVLTAVSIQGIFGGGQVSYPALFLCSLMGIGICTVAGTATGGLVTFFRMPPFVVTLALMMIARGAAYIIDVRFNSFLKGGTAAPIAVQIDSEAFSQLGTGSVLGIPVPILLTISLYLIAHVAMTRTSFGRYVYAVGGNPEAARLSGVPVRFVLIMVYTICGALTGLAGVIQASRFASGDPKAGELYELQVIAAVVVGGTSLAGGEGRIFGTLVGALIIAIIENGLNMAGVESYEQMVVFGLLILVAVLLDQMKKWKTTA